MTNKGILVLGGDREEIEIGPKDAVFIPPHTYHSIKNPYNVSVEILFILSLGGWVFDKHEDWEEKAKKGEEL